MKKTGLFKIIIFTLLGILLLTWIIPASYFESGDLTNLGMYRIGFFDFWSLIFGTFQYEYFIPMIIFLVSVGALYGVLVKTGKYRNWIDKIASNLKGTKGSMIFLICTAFVFAALTSVFNYGMLLFIFIPFIMSVILAMGYDKVTAVLTTVGAILIGEIGSTISYNINGVLNESLTTTLSDAIWFKLGLFVFAFGALVAFLICTAKKVSKEETKKMVEEDTFAGNTEIENSNKVSMKPLITILSVLFVLLILGCIAWSITFNVNVLWFEIGLLLFAGAFAGFLTLITKKGSVTLVNIVLSALFVVLVILYIIWPNIFELYFKLSLFVLAGVLVASLFRSIKKCPTASIITILSILFILLVLGCTAWSTIFNVNAFTSFNEKLSTITINGFAIISSILGSGTQAFGEWNYTEMAIMCILSAIIIGRAYSIKYIDIFKNMADGAKKMIMPTLLVMLTYAVLFFAGNTMFYPTIANFLINATSKFNIFFSSITMILGSALHVDFLYVANYVIPQLAAQDVAKNIIIILSQGLYGVTMFVVPTSALLVLGLSYLGVSYKEWIKKTWMLAVALLIIVIIATVLAAII